MNTNKVWVSVPSANIRATPAIDAQIVGSASRGTALKFARLEAGWYELTPGRWINASVVMTSGERAAAKKEQERDAEAKLKREGWWEEETGVLVRWCKSNCPTSAVIGDGSYWILEVWCKERACGDIYAQVNILNTADAVIGWTNDSAYGGRGARVFLTFQKYNLRGRHSARLVKFNARG